LGVRAAAAAALALVAALVVGCASTPATRLHTLLPAQSVPRPAQGTLTPIVLEPIRIPAQVDQPQWLVRLPDDSLAILEQERWSSPLQDELRQALLEELGRFGMVEAAVGASVPWRIRIELRRFESVPGREARIEGSWLLSAGDGRRPGLRCDWRYAESAGPGMPALANAHRRAVVRLAGALGESLGKLGRGETAACPAHDSP
jgi:hypothetical protein